MNKKDWMDYLFYKIGQQQYDFMVCGLNKVEDKTLSTKWRKYSDVCFPVDIGEDWKIEWVNQRQILPNEVVLDLEDKERIDEIIKTLKEKKALFYAYATGSKGYHIHIFFKKELTENQKLKIIQHYGADTQKASSKTMIALEFTPHWKSGKIKGLI